MAKYKIFITPSATEEIDDLPKKDCIRVTERIKSLADNPRPPGCQKLSGQEKYRVRQGNYRIVYSIEDTILIVTIVKVGDRKDVYR